MKWQEGEIVIAFHGKGVTGKCINVNEIKVSRNTGIFLDLIVDERCMNEITRTEGQACHKGLIMVDFILMLKVVIQLEQNVYIVYLDNI